jgi:hypothetical protein
VRSSAGWISWKHQLVKLLSSFCKCGVGTISYLEQSVSSVETCWYTAILIAPWWISQCMQEVRLISLSTSQLSFTILIQRHWTKNFSNLYDLPLTWRLNHWLFENIDLCLWGSDVLSFSLLYPLNSSKIN